MFEGKELIVVTGKGGVGRTTVSTAIGLAATEVNATGVVCEVAEQGVIPQLMEAGKPDRNGLTPLTANLWAATIDPDETLRAWIRSQFGPAIARTLGSSKSFSQLIAAAPGTAELLSLIKAWEMGPGRGFGKKTTDHDTVVLDAPASGHGVAMLKSPRTFADIAAGGPIRKQAERVWDLLRDEERCAIVAVALPAELPVTETIELDEWTREVLGRGLDLVIANRCEPESFSQAELKKLDGLAKSGSLPENAVALARAASERASDQATLLKTLADGVDCPVVELKAEPADVRPKDLAYSLSREILAVEAQSA